MTLRHMSNGATAAASNYMPQTTCNMAHTPVLNQLCRRTQIFQTTAKFVLIKRLVAAYAQLAAFLDAAAI
jgi:hypothetical protein